MRPSRVRICVVFFFASERRHAILQGDWSSDVCSSDLMRTVRPRHAVAGFTGSMVRWNFHGLEASHGVSVSHRSHGSTGNRQDPGRTFPGKKMAGHYGHQRVTTQNLKIVAADYEKGPLLVSRAVPGPRGGYIIVQGGSQ